MTEKGKERLKTISLVISLPIALSTIYSIFIAPWFEAGLEADVRYGITPPSPSLDAEFKAINESVSPESLRDLAGLKRSDAGTVAGDETAEAVERAVNNLGIALRLKVPNSTPYHISMIDGYWQIRIANQAKRQLEDVKISVPNAVVATISRNGVTDEIINTSGPVALGKLDPLERVSVVVWVSMAPSSYHENDVRLTHAGGLGALTFYGEAGPFARAIDKNLNLIILLLAGPVVWLLIMLIVSMFVRSKLKGSDAQDSEEHVIVVREEGSSSAQ